MPVFCKRISLGGCWEERFCDEERGIYVTNICSVKLRVNIQFLSTGLLAVLK